MVRISFQQTMSDESEPMKESPSSAMSGIAELVREHYLSVYRFAYRMSGTSHDAEDLAQQTFLNAQQRLAALREPDRVRAWLFMITRNLYRRKLRDARPVESLPLDGLPAPDAVKGFEPLDSESLQRALNLLPEEYRVVLVLFYFGDLPYREIATQLDLPMGTVMSRLSRGKQLLREWLKADDF